MSWVFAPKEDGPKECPVCGHLGPDIKKDGQNIWNQHSCYLICSRRSAYQKWISKTNKQQWIKWFDVCGKLVVDDLIQLILSYFDFAFCNRGRNGAWKLASTLDADDFQKLLSPLRSRGSLIPWTYCRTNRVALSDDYSSFKHFDIDCRCSVCSAIRYKSFNPGVDVEHLRRWYNHDYNKTNK